VSGSGNPASAVSYQIDTPAASVRTNGPGEYRVAVLSPSPATQGRTETEVAVLRGLVDVTTDRTSVTLRAGERSLVREDEAPSFAQPLNSARLDAIDRWSAARRDERTGRASAQYVPPDLRMYGATFDQYGTWQYAAPYGYVW